MGRIRLAGFLALVASLSLPIGVLQAEESGTWMLDSIQTCGLWNANPVMGESLTWSGHCEDGVAEGPGEVVWYLDGHEQSRYRGEYKNGRRHGFGEWHEMDGDYYKGHWQNDRANGLGLLVTAVGDRYSGSFRDHKFHGFGVWHEADGDRYEGQFTKGVFQGQGTLSYAEGGGYSGDFEEGLFSGRGVMVAATGEVFVGDFRQNKPDGRGTCHFAPEPPKGCEFLAGEFVAWLPEPVLD